MNEPEVWENIKFKDIIPGYLISNYGRVYNTSKNKIMHQKITLTGYCAVLLKTYTKGHQWILVHQLVADAFLPYCIPINEEYVPDHLDGVKTNNFYKNLEWKSRGDNVRSAFKQGLINNAGEHNKHATITDKQAHQICQLLSEHKTYDDIIDILGFEDCKSIRQLLVRIKNRHKWLHISKDYVFDTAKYQNRASRETLFHIDHIKKMIADGYRDFEIVDAIWGHDVEHRKSKCMTVSNIRKGKIYKKHNVLSSTTIPQGVHSSEWK